MPTEVLQLDPDLALGLAFRAHDPGRRAPGGRSTSGGVGARAAAAAAAARVGDDLGLTSLGSKK